ncbi:MAG TPA: TRAP transporter small permease [Desulfomonilaceae bacterium]|nr:TRAP transporter small permease [Desulfomonilaceae bacterium]
MKSFTKAMALTSRSMCAVATAGLIVMMVLTLADVALRAFGRPIPGTYELVGILGAIIIGFSIPYTTMARGHVIMDFLTGSLSGPARTALHVLTRLLAIAFFIVAGWNLCLLGHSYGRAGEVTLTLKLPLYPIFYVVAFCCFVECLMLVVELTPSERGSEQ